MKQARHTFVCCRPALNGSLSRSGNAAWLAKPSPPYRPIQNGSPDPKDSGIRARVRSVRAAARLLVAQGYTVRSEVRGCDVTATRPKPKRVRTI
jgi:hypothetical protein